MQGPVFNSELSEGGGKFEVEQISSSEEVNPKASERIKIVGGLYNLALDSDQKMFSLREGNFDYKLTVLAIDNPDVPLKLTFEKIGSYNELYQVYLSKNGEYLQRELVPEITNKIRKGIKRQGIKVEPIPEGFTKIDIQDSKFDDILLKFW